MAAASRVHASRDWWDSDPRLIAVPAARCGSNGMSTTAPTPAAAKMPFDLTGQAGGLRAAGVQHRDHRPLRQPGRGVLQPAEQGDRLVHRVRGQGGRHHQDVGQRDGPGERRGVRHVPGVRDRDPVGAVQHRGDPVDAVRGEFPFPQRPEDVGERGLGGGDHADRAGRRVGVRVGVDVGDAPGGDPLGPPAQGAGGVGGVPDRPPTRRGCWPGRRRG